MVRLIAAFAAIAFAPLSQEVIEQRLAAAPTKNAEREPALAKLFHTAGCDDVQEQAVPHTKAPNVICTLAGATESTIVVGAHFDFVEKGAGVVDNWSGAALLPSLFESLRTQPRHHTFRFIGFTAEEKGLIGSKYFVEHLPAGVRAAVNMDSLGTSPTKVESDRGDQELLADLEAVAAAQKLPLSVQNVHDLGYSDSDSFQDRNIPTVNLHSVTTETFALLHNNRDWIGAIHKSEYYDSYRLIAAYLAYLDQQLQ